MSEIIDPAATAGASTENANSNVEITPAADTTVTKEAISPATETPEQKVAKEVAAITAITEKPAYVPNFKYKAALEEKELDPFWRGLVKDAESEKKVKDLFTKVDAFDFVKGKKEHAEQQFNSLLGDFNTQTEIVQKFNGAVKDSDLSSAFRIAGISKEQVFKWTQKQLQLMEMPADQRDEYERSEQVRQQKSELEDRLTGLQKEFQTQAVQTRTMQLEMTLNRPEVAKFAEAWDANGEPGSFKAFVIDEAKKVFFETKEAGKPVDLSPEQAVARVMQRFGKFLNVGDTTAPSPQAIHPGTGQPSKPVIPNVVGKAASPVKKAYKNLDDLKALEKSMR